MPERKPKVLVVDDIQSNIEFVTDVLELENIEVRGASNGEIALQITREILPDLILLDISMPEIDGYEVCRILKDNPATADIPVIFLTARVQKEDILKGFEMGAVDYIIKPFNFNELISRVKTHIDLKQKTEKLVNVNQELESMVSERTQQLRFANQELKKTNEELKKANEELSKLDKIKTEFVLHINHELRTPLNGILGYLNLLAEQIQNEPQSGYLASIDSLTNRLIKLAELSLLFTELKTREHQIHIYPVDIVNTLNEAIDCRELDQKNIEIELENPLSPVKVLAESKLLSSCLSIVVDNAIKYSPENSTIKLVITRLKDRIELSIIDNGPGFSEKALEQLFNFFTADNLQYQSYGFGIGLATAKIILDLIGGSITVANRSPIGSIVKLEFVESKE